MVHALVPCYSSCTLIIFLIIIYTLTPTYLYLTTTLTYPLYCQMCLNVPPCRKASINSWSGPIKWAHHWRLKIAGHKCCVLSNGTNILPTYNLNGAQLLNVKKFRDLGIIVYVDCLFKQHISHICRKAYFSINAIFICLNTAKIAALIISYKSFIRPMLEYCFTVWNPYIPAIHYLGMTDQVEKVPLYFTRRVYQRCQLNFPLQFKLQIQLCEPEVTHSS